MWGVPRGHFCTTFRHFVSKVSFSRGTSSQFKSKDEDVSHDNTIFQTKCRKVHRLKMVSRNAQKRYWQQWKWSLKEGLGSFAPSGRILAHTWARLCASGHIWTHLGASACQGASERIWLPRQIWPHLGVCGHVRAYLGTCGHTPEPKCPEGAAAPQCLGSGGWIRPQGATN